MHGYPTQFATVGMATTLPDHYVPTPDVHWPFCNS